MERKRITFYYNMLSRHMLYQFTYICNSKEILYNFPFLLIISGWQMQKFCLFITYFFDGIIISVKHSY